MNALEQYQYKAELKTKELRLVNRLVILSRLALSDANKKVEFSVTKGEAMRGINKINKAKIAMVMMGKQNLI